MILIIKNGRKWPLTNLAELQTELENEGDKITEVDLDCAYSRYGENTSTPFGMQNSHDNRTRRDYHPIGTSIDNQIRPLLSALRGSKVTKLGLKYNLITAEGVGVIMSALQGGLVTELDLSYNSIGETGAQFIAAFLKDSPITKLTLRSCQIGIEGAKAIVAALKNNHHLHELDLSCNSAMGNAGVIAIAEALQNNPGAITKLDFSWCNIGDDAVKAIAEMLKNNPQITELSLRGNCSITAEGAKALAAVLKSSGITKLDLHECSRIRTEGAIAIAEVLPGSALTILDLSACKIGFKGIESIARHLEESDVTQLFLAYNVVGLDPDLSLYIMTAQMIAPCFMRSTVEVVDLSGCAIGDAGAVAIAENAVEAAKAGRVIKFILNDNDIVEDGIRAITEALEKTVGMIQFSFTHNSRMRCPDIVARAVELSAADVFDAGGTYFLGDPIASAILHNLSKTTVRKLVLSACRLTDDAVLNIGNDDLRGSALVELDLSCNMSSEGRGGITGVGVSVLARALPGSPVTTLKIGGNYGIGDSGAQALAAILPDTCLIEINLSRTNIGYPGAMALIEASSSLAKLDLRCARISSDHQEQTIEEFCRAAQKSDVLVELLVDFELSEDLKAHLDNNIKLRNKIGDILHRLMRERDATHLSDEEGQYILEHPNVVKSIVAEDISNRDKDVATFDDGTLQLDRRDERYSSTFYQATGAFLAGEARRSTNLAYSMFDIISDVPLPNHQAIFEALMRMVERRVTCGPETFRP